MPTKKKSRGTGRGDSGDQGHSNGPISPGGRGDSSPQYYYAQGQRIPVAARRDLVAVVYDDTHVSADRRAADASVRAIGLQPSAEFPEMQQSNVRIYETSGRRAMTDDSAAASLREQADVQNVGPVYINERDGRPMVLTDEIVARFKPETKANEIETLARAHGFEVLKPLGFSENAFLLRVIGETSPGRALDVANALVEGGHAVYAYPNWVEYIGYRRTTVTDAAYAPPLGEVRHGVHPTDPMFAQQWHLENTGQMAGGVAGTAGADIHATLAWQVTMGDPATVLAVIDGGTDIAHNDLNAPGKNVDPINLHTTPPTNNPVGGSHGTQCAGMAVATANNASVGAGSAPDCSLIAIRAGDTVAQLVMAFGFAYAADHGADVITCSLGPNGAPWTMTDGLRDAIDYATTFGRGGRGCAYFQAIDNQATRPDGSPNPISGDQVSSYERTIAVTRTTNRDLYAGAAMGPELDLSAPGVNVLTITNTTATNANTSATVTGTSFASPLAAGVGCLVVTLNPNLSWEEVRQVMLDSADKIDAAANPYAAAGAGLPPGTRNDRYGYGRVNAETAVQLAPAASPRDLYIRDTLSDTGTVPQPAWGFWDSPDIWVRNVDDNGLQHQDTIRTKDNFLHARIWNRGTAPSFPAWVRFIITSYAGTQFRYPLDFKPDMAATIPGGTPGNLRPAAQFPALGSYLIGVQRIESVPAGGNVIAKIRWPAALIPPEANWHPCLLVDVTPHDGPMPTGINVWENNNLGQKNITIVNARRGRIIDFPFLFSSKWAQRERFMSLDVRLGRLPRDWNVYLAPKDPELLAGIVKAAGIPMPKLTEPDTPESALLGSLGLPSPALEKIGEPPLPWRITFLEETRIAVSGSESGDDAEALVVMFPRQSTLEIGRQRISDLTVSDQEPADELTEEDEGRSEVDAAAMPRRPAFKLVDFEGTKVLKLNPGTHLSKIRVPLTTPGWKQSSLVVAVPQSAIPGEHYVFDVAQRDARGELVGGVRLRVNVIE